MLIAPGTPSETSRLSALHSTGLLDTAPERGFDDIVALAAQICLTPIALVTLVDRDRQWFKARIGLDVAETGRRESFCGHAIGYPELMTLVPDTHRDARFADNPLVTGAPYIRFYAGAPVVTSEGHALGTVCVIDSQPHQIMPWQAAALRALSDQVARLLEVGYLDRRSRVRARSKTGRALREAERTMAISASGAELASYVDHDFIYRFVNDTHLTYWARQRDQVVGHKMRQVVGARLFDRQFKPLLLRALAGEVLDVEREVTFPGRGVRNVLIHLEPARGSSGGIDGVVLRTRDVQPFADMLARLGERVERVERCTLQQEHVLHILSHDLREPLNAVLNFSGLAESAANGAEPLSAYLGYVRRGARRLKDMLDDLTRFVAVETERGERREVVLDEVLRDVLAEMAGQIQHSGAQVDTQPLPVVEGDPILARLMLRHLLDNALRFGRPGVVPRVRILAEDGGTHWRLCVSDNGIGIPEASRENVFDLFRRLHAPAEPEGPHSGLGLALCRRIAELHGGCISAQTNADGDGARIVVEWPRPARETGSEAA